MNSSETKNQIYEFDPVIYPYKLWIYIDESPKIISEHFNDSEGNVITSIEWDCKKLAAFAMPVRSKEKDECGVILYFRSKELMSYELVAHEASHAAKYLFGYINADVNPHEPFEFVVGWIAECCEKTMGNI